MDTLSDRLAPHLLSILRIVAALIFIEHGTQKLFGFPAAPEHGYPDFLSLLWWQGVIEVLGGGLLLLGVLTRFVAFILSGNMAFAYWMVHAQKSFYPALNGGDAAILYCFVFLYMAAAGGGSWSVDRLFKRLRAHSENNPASQTTCAHGNAEARSRFPMKRTWNFGSSLAGRTLPPVLYETAQRKGCTPCQSQRRDSSRRRKARSSGSQAPSSL